MQTQSYRKTVGFTLVACLVFGSVSASAAEVSKADAKAQAKEIVTREENKQDANLAFQKGIACYTQGKYEDAIQHYLKALTIVQNLPVAAQPGENAAMIEQIRKHISNAYRCWAEDLFKAAQKDAQAQKYEEAIRKCREAAAMYEPCKDIMDKEIARYEDAKRAMEFRTGAAVESVLPEYADNQNEIQIALQKARAFYKIGRWSDVIEQCRFVYTLDPYNTAAIDMERRATLKLVEAGKKRKDLAAEAALNEVSWSLVPPVLLSASDAGSEDGGNAPIQKLDPAQNLRSKLNTIKFTKLVFDQTPLNEVIQYLRERSKELDPAHEGVNFVLRFNDASAGAGTSGEGEGEEGEEESGEGEEGGEGESVFPTVTFYLGADDDGDEDGGGEAPVDSISLEKVIEAICQSAGIHYRVEEYAVVIAPENVPLDDNVIQTFKVDKDVIDSMEGSIAEGEEVSEDGEERSPIEIYLKRLGITFNKGAKAVYDVRTNNLIVSNTPEMLARVNDAVKDLAVSNNPQVQIQVKFMEISQKDLEELGFEYFVSRPTTYSMDSLNWREEKVGQGETILYNTPVYIYSHTLEDAKEGIDFLYSPTKQNAETLVPHHTKGPTAVTYNKGSSATQKWYIAEFPDQTTGHDRHSMTYGANSDGMVRNAMLNPVAFGGEDSLTTINDKVFNWSRITDQGHQYEASLHALDQADSADTLTCPRVTTMVGEEATLKMVTTKIYPTEWTEASLDEADGTSVFTPSTPDVQRDSEGQVDEGIALTVTPQLIGKDMIDMEMNPMILDFAGWVDYSYQIVLDGEEWPNTLKMPIIEVRSIETKVICHDQTTVVLGGIMKDKVSMVDDQYPILGDLPIVGRLFQSKGKGSAKTNLLIFLTASLVSPDGSFVNQYLSTGIPAF